MHLRFGAMALPLLLSVILSTGCSALGLGGKPNVTLLSPPHGSQYHEGEDVAVQSTATDPAGIVRVELLIDGTTVRADTPPGAQSQSSFTLIQTWKATRGTHIVSVRAYNTSNRASDQALVSVSVLPAPTLAPTATPTPFSTGTSTPTLPAPITPAAPTASPSSSPTSTQGRTAPCTDRAVFIADITIPDGTSMAPNQTFNKVWRVRNTGTCTWGAGYQLVFVSGEAMTPMTVIAVPPTSPGTNVDLSVGMAAPAAAGQHSGQWRLRNASGGFLPIVLSVVINVPLTPVPVAICPGSPVIPSFTASPNPIAIGSSTTLSWGAIINATFVTIDNGIGTITTPGTRTASPSATTTYTLTAIGCGGTAIRTVTVVVNPASTPPSTQLFDFVASAPDATWYSGTYPTSSGYLAWGASNNADGTNSEGFMRWVDNAVLENGTTYPRVLEMYPKRVTNGFIVGRYSITGTIQSGTHFKSNFGLVSGATGKVEFVVGVIVGGTPTRLLDVVKTATGTLGNADIDLSRYAGQSVQIYFQTIGRNPNSEQCRAVWVGPRLQR